MAETIPVLPPSEATASHGGSGIGPVTSGSGPASPDPQSQDEPIMEVPGYVLMEVIGQGGMGKVYAARELALGREVAIKVLLPSSDSSRFLVESQLTAKLAHPGIPPVYALGSTTSGQPFLAMKRIRGQTLATLLRARNQPADDLPRFLQVFEQIAQAVAFAHTRGVIHRDLKPSNVMVGEFGEVQVMDWGLARMPRTPSALDPGRESGVEWPTVDGGTVARTHTGALLGTLGYMPPEQARAEELGPTADVFALGAILAEILTGRPAFVGSNSWDVLFRTSAGDLSDVLERLEQCGADAELSGMAVRYLAENPERRPPQAGSVAEEIRDYQSRVEHRLRQAEAEAREYTIREGEQKKRQRLLIRAGGGIATVLLLGMGVSLWQMVRAQQAETASAKQFEETQKAETEAQRQLGYARQSRELMLSTLEEFDPTASYQTAADIREAFKTRVNAAALRFAEGSWGTPLTLAEFQETLGMLLMGMGDPKSALPLLRKSWITRKDHLGDDHHDTLLTQGRQAQCYLQCGQHSEAITHFEQVQLLSQTRYGPQDRVTITSLAQLAGCHWAMGQLEKAIGQYERVVSLAKTHLGVDHPDTIQSMGGLALAYRDADRLKQAVPLFEETVLLSQARLGVASQSTLKAMGNLAGCLRKDGQIERAIVCYETTIELQKSQLGASHRDTLVTMGNLALGYADAGQHEKSRLLLREVLKLKKQSLGPDHPDTLTSLNNLAMSHQATGDFKQAIPIFEEAMKLMLARPDSHYPHQIGVMNNLAQAYVSTQQLEKAIELLEQAYQHGKAQFGVGHPHTLTSLDNLGAAYCRSKQGKKAAVIFQEYLTAQRSRFPTEDLRFADLIPVIAIDLLGCQQFETAEVLLQECFTIQQKKKPEAWTTYQTQSLLGVALLGQKKIADAEFQLLQGYEGMKTREASIPEASRAKLMASTLSPIIQLYTIKQEPEAIQKYQQLQAIYSASPGK